MNSKDNMSLKSEMIEINLNGSNRDIHYMDSPKTHNAGFPYGYAKDVDADADADVDADSQRMRFYSKSKSTGELAERARKNMPAARNISCLRQMYCPRCDQRLHEEAVRLEQVYHFCCFPMFPLYGCCDKRPNSCKVICGKCDYYLGSWKQQ